MLSGLKKLVGREIEEYFGARVAAFIKGRAVYVTHAKKTMKRKTYEMFAKPQRLLDQEVKKLLIERKDIEKEIALADWSKFILVHGPESKY